MTTQEQTSRYLYAITYTRFAIECEATLPRHEIHAENLTQADAFAERDRMRKLKAHSTTEIDFACRSMLAADRYRGKIAPATYEERRAADFTLRQRARRSAR